MQNHLTSALLIASLLISLGSPAANAQSDTRFICEQYSMTRTITINYPTPEPVPCTVSYQKEDSSEVLWTAKTTEGYCEERAQAFAEKHRGWGWECAIEDSAAQ